MNRFNAKWLVGGALLVATAIAGVVTNAVFAGDGGSQGDGGHQGCGKEGWTLDTCYGATWREYKIQDIADGKYDSMSYDAANDTVTVKGKDPTEYAYAKGGKITGCYNPEAAGNGSIWRYAVVAYGKGYYTDGTFYVAGDQVGMLGINGNSNPVFNSQLEFGGSMNYIRPKNGGGAEWNDVKTLYLSYYNQGLPDFTKGWGHDRDGNVTDLAWFCGTPAGDSGGGGGIPQATEYWAKSSVSDRSSETSTGESDWQTTGIVNYQKTVSTNKTNIYTGSSGYLTFSHNIYSNLPNVSGISWGVTRTVEYGGKVYDGFNAISSQVQVVSEGSANHTSGATGAATVGTAFTTTERGEDGSRYIASPRNYTDGGSYYLLRDHYKASFAVPGDYTFCEEISVNGVKLTKACSKVHVTTMVGECDLVMALVINGSQTIGDTKVSSEVRNYRLSAAYADTVYAMPGDDIVWRNCYAPVAQMMHSKDVVKSKAVADGHGEEGVCNDTSNDYKKFYSVTQWNGHGFTVSTNSPYGINTVETGGTSGSDSASTGYPSGKYEEQPYQMSNSYAAQITDGGKTYTTSIKSENYDNEGEHLGAGRSPTSATITNEGTHPWTASCQDCNKCPDDCYGGWYYGVCLRWRCGTCDVSHSHTNNYYAWEAGYEQKTAQSSVIIPYNYSNTTSVKLMEEDRIVYAGKTANVRDAKVIVGEKWNNVTRATYTTQVDNAKVQMVAFTSSTIPSYKNTNSGSSACEILSDSRNIEGSISVQNCTILTQRNGNLNDDENAQLHGRTYEADGLKDDGGITFNGEYSVFDVAAGNYYCVALAVYPAGSGLDDNTVASGDNQWYVSVPSCARVAKKPSVQVLGSSILMTETGSKVSTQIAEKNNLLGGGKDFEYKPRSNIAMSFGSWVEEGVISNGEVRGLASGAALGEGQLFINGTTFAGRNGGASNSYCKNLVPLSFANVSRIGSIGAADELCSASGIGAEVTGHLNAQITETNRKALVDYFAAGTKVDENLQANDGFGDYYILKSPTGKYIYLTDGAGTLDISGGTLGASTTRVVRISGNVNINSDIIYANGGYDSAGLIPKVVIYASGNININCRVNRVDAMLIAGGTVNTCVIDENTRADRGLKMVDGKDVPDYELGEYAKQLTINGVVVANRIELNRTYGAATGTNSGTPAEIINYDSSSILWGRAMADASESDVMSTVYMHELAPRY